MVRSKKVVAMNKKRNLPKPTKSKRIEAELPPIEDHSDDEEDWSSTYESPDELNFTMPKHKKIAEQTSDTSSDEGLEDTYERQPRALLEEDHKGSARLPVKLRDGTIRQTGNRPAKESESESEASEGESHGEDDDVSEPTSTWETPVASGSQRPAIEFGADSRKERIRRAQEELATICQDIVTDPEENVKLASAHIVFLAID